jgi:hypothetical protein
VVALTLMLGAKLLNVSVPLIMKVGTPLLIIRSYQSQMQHVWSALASSGAARGQIEVSLWNW